MDASTGEIKLIGFQGDRLAYNKDDLRLRVIVERISETGEPPAFARQRYASPYIPLIIRDEDNQPIPGKSSQTIIIHNEESS